MLTLALWSLFFVMVGAAMYNADSYYGTSWYRRWYNATHGESLAENVRKGFIVGRNSKARFIFATFAVLTKVAVTILVEGGLHPLYEFLMWPVEVASLVVGFYLGPFVYEQWRRKEKAFAYLDKIESGEANIVKDLKKSVASVSDKAVGKIISFKKEVVSQESVRHASTVPEPAEPKLEMSQTPPEPTTEPQLSPEEALRKFTSKY